jgi:putative glutathione S-transferase
MGATHLHELYCVADNDFTGRVSIPILWDKKLKTVVNNNSGDIARMLNNEFNAFATKPKVDFYPSKLRREIDELNAFVGDCIMDNVYRCLLAASQEQFDDAFLALFNSLDSLDKKLNKTRYLVGSRPTEPDWRLFACLVRFDAIYYGLYRCNWKRIVEYTNLWGYTRDLFQFEDAGETVNLSAIKRGYYGIVAPKSFIPKGPNLDFLAPHKRHLRFSS